MKKDVIPVTPKRDIGYSKNDRTME